MLRRQHIPTLFPYTTLFRSQSFDVLAVIDALVDDGSFFEIKKRFAREIVTGFANRFLISLADRKSTRLNSSHLGISYAVFCLKKKKKINTYCKYAIYHTNHS